MSERDILRKAKGVLLERGWHQGAYCADPLGLRGPMCLAGAMKTAAFGNPYHSSAGRQEDVMLWAIYRTLRDLIGAKDLVMWNDEPGRTVDDVVALIDRALGSLPAEAPELEEAVVA